MTREILHKAKRRDTNEWELGLPSYNPYDGDITEIEIRDSGFVEIDPETICQYIGTNRKDEKIWEGDIFREDNGEYIATYFIEWDDTNMQWWAREIESSEGDLPLCEFYLSEIDVIGNIFDNPEIVEKITKGVVL